jgi:predicted nicotinamide N-methyase
MLLLAVHSSALIISGVATKRVLPGTGLPFVYEAAWEATATGAVEHDPLSSCFWPAATPLARLVAALATPGEERYLELGCGTGLISLTVAKAGASHVLATDVSHTALAFTMAAAHDQDLDVETRFFDVLSEAPLPCADVLILSDLFVTDELARAYAKRVTEALGQHGFRRIFVVDPGRSTRRTFLDALRASSVAHNGFAAADECLELAREGERLLLLDTEEGAPVSYCI